MAKLNKSTSTSAKMKATGASRSTTSRDGTQRFFASGTGEDKGKLIGTSTRTTSTVAPIVADNLGTKTDPIKPPSGPVTDPLTGLFDGINTGIASSSNGELTYDKNGFTVKQSNDPEKQLQNNALNRLYSLAGLEAEQPDAEGTLKDVEKETGVNRFRRERNQAQEQLNSLIAESNAQKLSLERQGRGQTEGFIGGEQARIDREAAIRALPIQANLQAAQGNLELAQETVNKLFQVRMQDAQNRFDFKSKVISTYYDAADAVQQRKLDALKIKNQQDFQIQMQNSQFQQQKDLLAIKNRYDQQNAVPEYTGQYANVVNIASGLVGAERGKTIKAGIVNALKGGDLPTAYALIGNAVEESLTGDVKTKFANARTDYQVMQGMRSAIQEYQSSGGDMGFLKGTTAEITRKLGQLTTDPRFATLAIQLQREFQSYRQNMTGAAFGKGESAEYESVNPRGSAGIELNLITIDGAMNQLENRITSTINTRVPGAGGIYSSVSGQQGQEDESLLSDDDAYTKYLNYVTNLQIPKSVR